MLAWPDIPEVTVGETYEYQGRSDKILGRKVMVIAHRWPGASHPLDMYLVHAALLKKGVPTEATFAARLAFLLQSLRVRRIPAKCC